MKAFWYRIEDKLPPRTIKRGILARWAQAPECGHDFTISNVDYIRYHPHQFTHWAKIPRLRGIK